MPSMYLGKALLGWAVILGAFYVGQLRARADVVTFESDPVGIKSNGFQSVDSGNVSFSASAGGTLAPGTLIVGPEVGSMEFIGSRGLAVFGSPNIRLVMDFLVPANSLSLSFGNDDPLSTTPGDRAVLRLFDGGLLVGEVSILLNRNDIIDQTISFSGAVFTSATFGYTAEFFLVETVDNITFTPVPEPASLVLLLTGVAGAAVKAGRGRSREP